MKKPKFNPSRLLPALALFCLTTTAQAVIIELELQNATIMAGDSFDVNVVVDTIPANDGLLSFGFDVTNDAGLTFESATVNTLSFLDDSALFADTDVAGFVDLMSPPVNGNDILLATLSFSATTAGNFSLGIESDLTNLNQGMFVLSQLTPIDMDASLAVSVASQPNPGQVPVPSTAFLLGMGVAGLLAGRKQIEAS